MVKLKLIFFTLTSLIAGVSFFFLFFGSLGKISSQDRFQIDTFEKAKKALRRIYRAYPVEFYCGCAIVSGSELNSYSIDPNECGLDFRKNAKRSFRLEWEHIVPAHRFGKNLPCWAGSTCSYIKKGRKCCKDSDPSFQEMEGDMHNLVPAAGELNADRGNFSYGEIPGEPRLYGKCDFEVDFKKEIVEIRPEIRGDVARAYLYMNDTYNISLNSEEKTRFLEWNELDPPSEWEKEKARIVERFQGKTNKWILP